MRAAMRMVLYLTAFAAGGLLVAMNALPEFGERAHLFLRSARGQLVSDGLAVVFLVCPLIILLRWWQVVRRAREISYTTESGKISVSLIAIEEALTRAIEGESEVKKATVRVFEDRVKRAIVIEAVVTLWEVANVTERNRFCQRLLRRRFAELMPEQTVVQVNLTIHRLNQRRVEARPTAAPPVPAAAGAAPADEAPKRPSSSDLLPAEPDDDDLYVGPAYPVMRDDEEEGGTGYYFRSKAAAKTTSGAGKS
jgi:hypothetical protein